MTQHQRLIKAIRLNELNFQHENIAIRTDGKISKILYYGSCVVEYRNDTHELISYSFAGYCGYSRTTKVINAALEGLGLDYHIQTNNGKVTKVYKGSKKYYSYEWLTNL